MKKILSLFLILCTIVTLVTTAPVIAETSGKCGENVTWIYANGTLTISGTGDMWDWFSPSNVSWVIKKSSIKTVIIKIGVTSIGDYAFYGCSGLISITISDSVTDIGDSALEDCASLTSITIPDSVTDIGYNAFCSCKNLSMVYISDIAAWLDIKFNNDGSNPLYYAHNLYLNDSRITDLVIPDSVTSIGGFTFNGYTGLTSVIIPDSVADIGNSAFSGCSGLTNVTIPNSVTSIGDTAFFKCSGLTSITISDRVTRIGVYAFGDCFGLTNITIPGSVTEIGDAAFYGCSGLSSVTIPDRVTSIGGSAFSGCSGLTSVTISDSVTDIGSYAFYKCNNLREVHVSDVAVWCNIKFYVENSDFSSNPLCYAHNLYLKDNRITDLVIPDGVTNIGSYTFYGCSGLTSVTIPDGVTNIGDAAFRDCTSLISVTIPDSVTSIGGWAFSSCAGLTNITMPNGITRVDGWAFWGCKNLSDVWYDGTEEEKEKINIQEKNENLLNATWHYNGMRQVNIPNYEKGGDVIVAIYDSDDKLISVNSYTPAEYINASYGRYGVYMKVVQWEAGTMKPLALEQRIDL